jgi:predicted enzyme related to lactoylglutathione lyase
MKSVIILLACVLLPIAASATAEENPVIRTHAVKINVDDMDKAISFYCDKLGFEIESRENYPQQVFLKTNDRIKLIINRVKKLQKPAAEDTAAGFTLQVNDLDQAIARMKSMGVEFAETEKRKEGVGYAISIRDPFGRSLSMMHQTIVKVEPFKEPRIYNFGYKVPDMTVARDFYSKRLGFIERSEKYLPLDMPLGHSDKSFAFMLHYRAGVKPIKNDYSKAAPFNTIVFETVDLDRAVSALKKSGVKILSTQKNATSNYIVFEDPFGNVSELIEVPVK